MVKNAEELADLLRGLAPTKTDWVADFSAKAIFENEVLRGFEMGPIFDNLTVQQFKDFLAAENMRIEFGPKEGRHIWENYYPDPKASRGCKATNYWTCIPTG
jgi:hypothetical protein